MQKEKKFGKKEVLTRDQLKNTLGGNPPVGGTGEIENTWLCWCEGSSASRQSVYGRTQQEARQNFDATYCNEGAIAYCYPY